MLDTSPVSPVPLWLQVAAADGSRLCWSQFCPEYLIYLGGAQSLTKSWFSVGSLREAVLSTGNDVIALKSSLKMTLASACWARTEIVLLHYPVSFTCRSRRASHALLQTHTVLGRAEIALAQLTKGEVESRNALNTSFCLCQVHTRSWAKKYLLKAPEQMAGADHGLCAPAFGCLSHKIAPSP